MLIANRVFFIIDVIKPYFRNYILLYSYFVWQVSCCRIVFWVYVRNFKKRFVLYFFKRLCLYEIRLLETNKG